MLSGKEVRLACRLCSVCLSKCLSGVCLSKCPAVVRQCAVSKCVQCGQAVCCCVQVCVAVVPLTVGGCRRRLSQALPDPGTSVPARIPTSGPHKSPPPPVFQTPPSGLLLDHWSLLVNPKHLYCSLQVASLLFISGPLATKLCYTVKREEPILLELMFLVLCVHSLRG